MVIPWRLVLTAAAGILLGAWWASRRGARRGVQEQAPVDVAIVVAISAVVAGRLTVLAADVALLGLGALDPRAVLTLGAGVSTSGALLGALAAGAWLQSRGKVAEGAWRATVPPAALGLAVWSLLSLVRLSAAGVAAPFPLGWPLPGAEGTRVPVGVLEALAYGGFAWAVWRAERRGPTASLARMPGSRLAGLLLLVVAVVNLLGSALRPTVPTVDADVEILLGVLALVLGLLVVADLDRARARRLLAGVTGVGLLLFAVVIAGARLPAQETLTRAESEDVSLDGAIWSGGERDRAVPRWDQADLARYAEDMGVPVVVNVWASWCPPCRAEAPVLHRAVRAYGQSVVFVGVNVDRDVEAAHAFAERYRLLFPSVHEAPGLRKALGVPGLPTTLVIRPDGSIAARIVGGLDAGSLAAAIDRAR